MTGSEVPTVSKDLPHKEGISIRSQDASVTDTEVGQFALEGDAEFAKSSQISITEKSEVLVSHPTDHVVSETDEMLKDQEDLPRKSPDIEDRIVDLPEDTRKGETADRSLVAKAEPDTIDGEKMKVAEKGESSEVKWSPDPIKMRTKDIPTATDEGAADEDDNEFQEKDFFRENWSPDAIKTEQEREGSDEDDQFEEFEIVPQEEKDMEPGDKVKTYVPMLEETERGEEFLYVEKHERISKVFPIASVAEVDEQESKKGRLKEEDRGSFGEDWSPDAIHTKVDSDGIRQSEASSDNEGDIFEDAVPNVIDSPVSKLQTSDEKEQRDILDNQATTEHAEEKHIYEDWTPDVIPQRPGVDATELLSPEEEFNETKKPKQLPSGKYSVKEFSLEEKTTVGRQVVTEYSTEGDIYEEYIDEDWIPDAIPQKSSEDDKSIDQVPFNEDIKPTDHRETDSSKSRETDVPGIPSGTKTKATSVEYVISKRDTEGREPKKQFKEQFGGDFTAEEDIYEDTLDDQWTPDVIPQKPDGVDFKQSRLGRASDSFGDLTEERTNVDVKVEEERSSTDENVQEDIYEEYMTEDWTPDVIPKKDYLEPSPRNTTPEPIELNAAASKPKVDKTKYEKTDKYAQDIKYLPDGTTAVVEETHEDISKVILDEKDTITPVPDESNVAEPDEAIEEAVEVIEEGGEEEPKKGKRKRKRRRKKNKATSELQSETKEEKQDVQDPTGDEIAIEDTANEVIENEERPQISKDEIPHAPKKTTFKKDDISNAKEDTNDNEAPLLDPLKESRIDEGAESYFGDTLEEPKADKHGGDERFAPKQELDETVTEVDEEYFREDWSADIIPHRPNELDKETEQSLPGDTAVPSDTATTDENKLLEDENRLERTDKTTDEKLGEVEKEYLPVGDTFEEDIYGDYVQENWSPDTIPQKPDYTSKSENEVRNVDELFEGEKETTYILKLAADRDIEDIEEEKSEEKSRTSSDSEFAELENDDKEYFREQWSPDIIKTGQKETGKEDVKKDDERDEPKELPSESDGELFEDAEQKSDELDSSEEEDFKKITETERSETVTYEEKHERMSKIFSSEKTTVTEVAEQDVTIDEEKEEPVDSSDESFRETWSPDVIQVRRHAHEDESKEGGTKDENSKQDIEPLEEKTEEFGEPVEETSDLSPFMGDEPSVDNIQLFEFTPKREKLTFRMDKTRTDISSKDTVSKSQGKTEGKRSLVSDDAAKAPGKQTTDEEKYYEEYHREWSYDVKLEETETTSESEDDHFEDAAVGVKADDQDESTTFTEKREGMSKVFSSEQSTVVMVSEQDQLSDEKIVSENVSTQSDVDTSEEITDVSEVGKEEMYGDYFREEWSPDAITMAGKEPQDSPIDSKEYAVDIPKEQPPNEKDAQVSPQGVITFKTTTEDINFSEVNERDTQESGYYGSLSVDSSAENIQMLETSPEPEKLILHLDSKTSDTPIDKIAANVDTPSTVVSVEIPVSDVEVKDKETDSMEEDVRVEFRDKDDQPIEKPPTPRDAVAVVDTSEGLTREVDAPTGQLENDVTVEDIVLKETQDEGITTVVQDRPKAEDITFTGVDDKTRGVADVEKQVTDDDLEDTRRKVDERPTTELTEPGRHETSDSLEFSTTKKSPPAKVVITTPSDSGDLEVTDEHDKPEDLEADGEKTITTEVDHVTSTMALEETDQKDKVSIDQIPSESVDEIRPSGKIQTDVIVEEIHFGLKPHELKDAGTSAVKDSTLPIPIKSGQGSITFETQTEDISFTNITRDDHVPDNESERTTISIKGFKTDAELVEKDASITTVNVDVETEEITFSEASDEPRVSFDTVQESISLDVKETEEKPADRETLTPVNVTKGVDVAEVTDVEERVTEVDQDITDIEQANKLASDESGTEDVEYEETDKYVENVKYLPDGTCVVLKESYEGISKVLQGPEDTLGMVAEKDHTISDDTLEGDNLKATDTKRNIVDDSEDESERVEAPIDDQLDPVELQNKDVQIEPVPAEEPIEEGEEAVEEEPKKGKRKRKRRRNKNKAPAELPREFTEEKEPVGEKFTAKSSELEAEDQYVSSDQPSKEREEHIEDKDDGWELQTAQMTNIEDDKQDPSKIKISPTHLKDEEIFEDAEHDMEEVTVPASDAESQEEIMHGKDGGRENVLKVQSGKEKEKVDKFTEEPASGDQLLKEAQLETQEENEAVDKEQKYIADGSTSVTEEIPVLKDEELSFTDDDEKIVDISDPKDPNQIQSDTEQLSGEQDAPKEGEYSDEEFDKSKEYKDISKASMKPNDTQIMVAEQDRVIKDDKVKEDDDVKGVDVEHHAVEIIEQEAEFFEAIDDQAESTDSQDHGSRKESVPAEMLGKESLEEEVEDEGAKKGKRRRKRKRNRNKAPSELYRETEDEKRTDKDTEPRSYEPTAPEEERGHSDQECDTSEEYTRKDIPEKLPKEESKTGVPHSAEEGKADTLSEETGTPVTVTEVKYKQTDSEIQGHYEVKGTAETDEAIDTSRHEEQKMSIKASVGDQKVSETVSVITPASIEKTKEDVTVFGRLILRGQYQIEEHPIDVQLPISDQDAAKGNISVEELKEDFEFKGDQKYVGTVSVDIPVTESTYDKVIPPSIVVNTDDNVENIRFHVPEEANKEDIDTSKPQTVSEIEKGDKHLLPEDEESTELGTVFADKASEKSLEKKAKAGDENKLETTSIDISKHTELKEPAIPVTDSGENATVEIHSLEDEGTKPSAPLLEDPDEPQRKFEDIETVVEPSAPPMDDDVKDDVPSVLRAPEDIEEV